MKPNSKESVVSEIKDIIEEYKLAANAFISNSKEVVSHINLV